jgi:hypothetical protein
MEPPGLASWDLVTALYQKREALASFANLMSELMSGHQQGDFML